jgi:Brp/Blh family beta-carotene 15,15'-monooxygenase
MKYLESAFFKYQLLVQTVLLTLVWFLPPGVKENVLQVIAFMFLLVVGIPHGANDLLYRKSQNFRGAVVFLSLYLGSMAAYAFVWWLAPVVALAVFLVISVHHFGQSNFENSKKLHVPSLLWGAWLLLAPVLIHFEESMGIFADMTASDTVSVGYVPIFWAIRFGVLGIYLAVSIYIYPKVWYLLVIQGVLVAWWYEISPLLSGFIIVFALWHSSQSLYYQWRHYQTIDVPKPSLRFFVGNMTIFTVVAGIFLWSISYFVQLNISVLFILLSIITLPHVVVMDGIYEKQQ